MTNIIQFGSAESTQNLASEAQQRLEKAAIAGQALHSKYATQVRISNPNRNSLFVIYNSDGSLKHGIKRAFLSAKWISREEAETGQLALEKEPMVFYNLTMTNALAYALAGGARARAICSFQIMEDGSRRVIAKLMTRRMDDQRTSVEAQIAELIPGARR